ncbi:hypothetical protein PLEOSDRAFT_169773 [Pleurotus ostreatus PC15]|uniref:Uncharacterized protein n=1 Tax=Pleurotus ostreatus (strain PC15) TaxID=1137138 RepID=A0A067NPA0_PLEO1|nr:hypothetical protein PLEOSDRAFT_169773 [Pleurotus ostreatus PC15]
MAERRPHIDENIPRILVLRHAGMPNMLRKLWSYQFTAQLPKRLVLAFARLIFLPFSCHSWDHVPAGILSHSFEARGTEEYPSQMIIPDLGPLDGAAVDGVRRGQHLVEFHDVQHDDPQEPRLASSNPSELCGRHCLCPPGEKILHSRSGKHPGQKPQLKGGEEAEATRLARLETGEGEGDGEGDGGEGHNSCLKTTTAFNARGEDINPEARSEDDSTYCRRSPEAALKWCIDCDCHRRSAGRRGTRSRSFKQGFFSAATSRQRSAKLPGLDQPSFLYLHLDLQLQDLCCRTIHHYLPTQYRGASPASRPPWGFLKRGLHADARPPARNG